MAVTYFKRYRMELRLDRMPTLSDADRSRLVLGGSGESQVTGSDTSEVQLSFLPWAPRLANLHAEVKHASFREEIDAHVFPCLADLDGCRQLMREISGRKNFVPQATWLACRTNDFSAQLQPCGTIQGLKSSAREGAIQNLGVHPECRDMGIGTALLQRALEGFRDAGCHFVHLEVTVQNAAAIRLYERHGFRHVETLFKIADLQLT